MDRADLQKLLDDARRVRLAVIGDFCLDAYWFIDDSASEPSLETGLPTRPVREQRYSLGGAGNVVHNLAAAGCGAVHALGVIGDDPWGRTLTALLRQAGAETAGLLVQTEDWATPAYAKPHLGKAEQNRIDFGNFNTLSEANGDRLISLLEGLLPRLDAVVVNQQLRRGLHTPGFRRALVDLIQRHPGRIFIADSRHYSEAFSGACLKINDHEAARLCGMERPAEALVLRSEAAAAAEALFAKLGRPVFVTRGERGCLVRDAAGLHEIPGIQVLGPTDTVGAGDSMLAGIAVALAAGRDPAAAAELGNFAAAVTVQKLRQTGTASPEELLALGGDPDYVLEPELAEDARQARLLPGTEFEIVTRPPEGLRLTHAIFDHDGTISTLREGWEQIMEPMMVRAVLGRRFDSADESLYLQVVARVRAYIERSTGLPTLAQMRGLVDMVREFECVPGPEILDAAGYKKEYNAALLGKVRGRLDKLERGELAVEDFLIKKSALFLGRLAEAGVKLYLASGTDRDDVAAEARGLGYAGLFTGGIYGSAGGVERDAKRVVLDRILADIGRDRVRGLAAFGDGPVEIRETRKRGGYAVGVASDEVRRFGWNPAKRARLIRAGADLLVPDFSQSDQLLELLGIRP